MTGPAAGGAPGDPDGRRWLILGVGLLAMIAGCAAQYGLAFLIPALRAGGLTLPEAGFLVSAPIFGVMATLIVWGAAADRFGERIVLVSGLGVAGVLLLVAALATPGMTVLWVLLAAAGAASASIHAASGRLILGWFPARLRGRAMAVRQTGQPIGVAIAAIVLPRLATVSISAALAFLAVGCLVAAIVVAWIVRDPVRPAAPAATVSGEPYRTPFLWRLHAASGLLVIPQWAIATFAFDFLVHARGWSVEGAGALLAAAQLSGAAGRLAVGWWSDRVMSRLRPMRVVALLVAAVMAALAVGAFLDSEAAALAVALASIITVSPNGLAFTAVAEWAGSRWAGRAMAIQNTVQNGVAAVTAPALAGLIVAAGGGGPAYGVAFGAVGALPVLAAVLIPVSDERPHSST